MNRTVTPAQLAQHMVARHQAINLGLLAAHQQQGPGPQQQQQGPGPQHVGPTDPMILNPQAAQASGLPPFASSPMGLPSPTGQPPMTAMGPAAIPQNAGDPLGLPPQAQIPGPGQAPVPMQPQAPPQGMPQAGPQGQMQGAGQGHMQGPGQPDPAMLQAIIASRLKHGAH